MARSDRMGGYLLGEKSAFFAWTLDSVSDSIQNGSKRPHLIVLHCTCSMPKDTFLV